MRSKNGSGININWLLDSNNKQISRFIEIRQCDLTANAGPGLEISSKKYSAHNIKIIIENNNIYRNLREGILIESLALSHLTLTCNEIRKNECDNLRIHQVHHKSNKKYAFLI